MLECLFTKIVVLLVVTMESWRSGAARDYPIAKEGCPDECGGIQIPYPFGIGDGCFFNQTDSSLEEQGFRINCDHTTNPSVPYLGSGSIKQEVLSINFIDDQSVHISSGVAYECYDNGKLVASRHSSTPVNMFALDLSNRNMFVTVGCDTVASFDAYDASVAHMQEGCNTSCINSEAVRNDTCDSLHGCCEVSIVGTISNSSIDFEGSSRHNKACRYAFFSEVGWYNLPAVNLAITATDCDNIRVPVIYDWSLRRWLYNGDSADVCGSNTNAIVENCQCLEGYTGNPFLACQDINECMDNRLNDCQKAEFCVNKNGGYECRCPDGHNGIGTMTSPCIAVNGVGNEVAKPGCPSECSGVKIPFPFGIGLGCFAKDMFEFEIKCDAINATNPKPTLPFLGNREVLSINTENHTLRLSYGVDCMCYNASYPYEITYINTLSMDSRDPFRILATRNNFVVVGCVATASLVNDFRTNMAKYVSACATFCIDTEEVSPGTCDSVHGCCEAPILENLSNPSIYLTNMTSTDGFNFYGGNLCTYAFVQEVGSFNFSEPRSTSTPDDCDKIRVPVLYDWYVSALDMNCSEAKMDGDSSYYHLSTMCRSNTQLACLKGISHDHVYDISGYRCQCVEGYDGNPYLSHGCQDINECLEEGLNDCQRPEFCVNKDGGYDCKCPRRHHGNGTTASPCIPTHVDHLILGLSIGMGSMIGVILLYGFYKLLKRRKDVKEREHNFKKNGGLLLQQEMSTNEGAIDRTKIFSRTELEKATDNFNNSRVLGCGGQGTVYKGMLPDGTIVAVKKSTKVDEHQLGQFINEVVILSQINHRNVVKLFGCCLETEVPLLVYEFVPGGTLYQHIHHPSEDFHMTWEVRFQIAVECAGAVAYLHSSCSSPIYHRDIKSSNILLDEKYKAKIADFGTSRSISIDETHVTTCVQGTFGYLDPEFFRSNHFSEKSDVYSFGVVLLELLTSKKPIFTEMSREARSLATQFVQLMETSPNELHSMLDAQILQQSSEEEIEALAKLIERCLSLSGKHRPTMKEVVTTLERIKSDHGKESHPANDHEIGRQEAWLFPNDEEGITNEGTTIDTSSYNNDSYSDVQPLSIDWN